MKASLCSIVNEFGHVLMTSIVPSDKRIHVQQMLAQLWLTTGRKVETKFIFTDDSVKGNSITINKITTILIYFHQLSDKNSICSCWEEIFPDFVPPNICQDLWHVLHRIDQVLNHRHPGKAYCMNLP